MTVITRSMPSPIGDLLLVGDAESLRALYLPDHRRAPVLDAAVEDPAAFEDAVRQLEEWFDGERTTFDLRVAAHGSGFQHAVWQVLNEIPFGATMTYGEVAARAGRPGCARAVGSAVARNPVSIIVPCHRVVGSGGSLTGYAGGLDRKRWLLEHERLVTTKGRPRLP